MLGRTPECRNNIKKFFSSVELLSSKYFACRYYVGPSIVITVLPVHSYVDMKKLKKTIPLLPRSSVICMFPELKSLDFAKVTEDEKDSARLQIIVNSKKNNAGKRGNGSRAANHKDTVKKYSL